MNIIQVYKQFPTKDDCIDHLEKVRWHGTPACPYCTSTNCTPAKNERRYHCNTCNTSFSVTVKTIFHRTHIDLQKWFLAIALVLDAKKGISSRQLSRHLEVNKDTAWSMAMRISRAMHEQRELLEGIVEMDETYIGGKPRGRHHNNKNGGAAIGPNGKRITGRGTDKTPVVGMVERGGKIVAQPVRRVNGKVLASLVRERVDVEFSTVITDQFCGYLKFSQFVDHKRINHKRWFAIGDIHTNTIESFWSLLKRGIIGQYHKVSVRYLQRYIDEFCFRQNHHGSDIFALALERAVGVIG